MKPRGRADDATRTILDALRQILRYLRNTAATEHAAMGITVAQLFVLQTLAEARGPLSVNELALRTYTDQSTVSVVARKLEERGLLARRRSGADARRIDLSVTSKARGLLRQSGKSPQHRFVEGILGLPPQTRGELAKSLSMLLHAMGLDHAPAPMMFEDETSGPRARMRRS